MSRSRKVFSFFIAAIIAGGVYYYFTNTPSKTLSLQMHNELVLDEKTMAINSLDSQTQRAPASVNKASIALNSHSLNHTQTQKLIAKTEAMYFSKLPTNIKWQLETVSVHSKGQNVKISLVDTKSGKKTSYMALVEADSGKILTTWHREIRH